MPRIPRKDMETSFFHIMVQGIKKEFIFNNHFDMKKYQDLFTEENEKNEIIAYCIMNNHAHLLVKIKNIKDLEEWMHIVNLRYSLYYNKKYNRVGYVFRNRYKSQIIKDEKHLFSCIEYIHNNPVKAGISKKQEEYNYSSLKSMYNGNKNNAYKKNCDILGYEYDPENDNMVNLDLQYFIDIDEDKERKCNDIIEKYLQRNKLSFYDLIRDRLKLKKLVEILKNEFKISYRTMEKCLKVSREKLRKMSIE